MGFYESSIWAWRQQFKQTVFKDFQEASTEKIFRRNIFTGNLLSFLKYTSIISVFTNKEQI